MDYTKYIDSVVGNIARKIEDEFKEEDHPRDKGGKFTSKGGEGKGGAKEEAKKKKDPIPETETEKSAKEELSEKEQKIAAIEKEDEEFNKLSNDLLNIASDLDTANDALRALGWDNDYDDLERAQEALKEAIRRDPKKAQELLESTPEDTQEITGYSYKEDVDAVVEEFVGSGIDMYAALEDLGIKSDHIPEGYLEEVLAEELYDNPKLLDKAKDYIKRYRSGEMEDAAPKKNRLGRNPLEKIDNNELGETGVGSIIKKTGN